MGDCELANCLLAPAFHFYTPSRCGIWGVYVCRYGDESMVAV